MGVRIHRWGFEGLSHNQLCSPKYINVLNDLLAGLSNLHSRPAVEYKPCLPGILEGISDGGRIDRRSI